MDSSSILHELSRDRIDIGIATLGENGVGGLHSEPLLSDRFGVICAPSHPLAQTQGPVSWEALAGGERLIANSLSAGIGAQASRDLHDRALLSAHNLTSILAMVHAEIGVTILPEMAVRTSYSPSLTFRPPLADTQAKRTIHLLRRADSTMSPPAARLLEQRIRECASEMDLGGASS